MAAVTWRELVFIFKETKFFVLWGEGVGTDNNPTFQVREVVNSVGLRSKLGVTVGRDGVYFFNRRGVYRTTGGDPVLLSDIISPLWTGDPELVLPGRADQPRPARAGPAALVHGAAVRRGPDRVRARSTTGCSSTTPSTTGGPSTTSPPPRSRRSAGLTGSSCITATATARERVAHRSYGSTTDRGQRIVSRWRSGWSDYDIEPGEDDPGEQGLGTGACAISFSIDFERAQTHPIDLSFGDVGRWPTFAWRYQDLTARGGTLRAARDPVRHLRGPDRERADRSATATDIMSWDEWLAQYSGRWPTDQIGNLLVRRAVRGTLFSTQFANSPQARDMGRAAHRPASARRSGSLRSDELSVRQRQPRQPGRRQRRRDDRHPRPVQRHQGVPEPADDAEHSAGDDLLERIEALEARVRELESQ